MSYKKDDLNKVAGGADNKTDNGAVPPKAVCFYGIQRPMKPHAEEITEKEKVHRLTDNELGEKVVGGESQIRDNRPMPLYGISPEKHPIIMAKYGVHHIPSSPGKEEDKKDDKESDIKPLEPNKN